MEYLFLLVVVPGLILFGCLLALYYYYIKTKTVNKKLVVTVIVSAGVLFICLVVWGILRNFYPPGILNV